MKYAIKSKVAGNPTIDASDAYTRLRDKENWGLAQRKEGWKCPFCMQPVFLKGPHERQRFGSRAHVEAHFSHYSATSDLFCSLLNPGNSQSKSIVVLEQSVNHEQLLSLFYSIPDQDEDSAWPSEIARSEAIHLANILDSIGVDSVEDDEAIHLALTKNGVIHKDMETQINSLLEADNYTAGLMSLGLGGFAHLHSGPLSQKLRPNAIRKFIIRIGSDRKSYFRGIIRSEDTETHYTQTKKLQEEAAKAWKGGMPLPGYLQSMMGILETILIQTGARNEPGTHLLIDASAYITHLPVVAARKPALEIVSHKSMLPKEKKQATPKCREDQPLRHEAYISKSKKALILEKTLIQKIAPIIAAKGAHCYFLDSDSKKEYFTDTFLAIPVPDGIFIASRLQYTGITMVPLQKQDFLNTRGEIKARDADWESRTTLHPSNGGIRIEKDTLAAILLRKRLPSSSLPVIEPGPKEYMITSRGIFVRLSRRGN